MPVTEVLCTAYRCR